MSYLNFFPPGYVVLACMNVCVCVCIYIYIYISLGIAWILFFSFQLWIVEQTGLLKSDFKTWRMVFARICSTLMNYSSDILLMRESIIYVCVCVCIYMTYFIWKLYISFYEYMQFTWDEKKFILGFILLSSPVFEGFYDLS